MGESRRPPAADVLAPYLPRLVVEWLQSDAENRSRTVEGTALFADISGFTQLTERLASKGLVGSEEMGDTLNLIFGALVEPAYDLGAGLVKWGGDAVLLLFEGPEHAVRAGAAALVMQRVIGKVGQTRTSAGKVRLRMSIGVHTGELDFFLVGENFRELIVTGPGASAVAQLETAAEAGEIVVSAATAQAITAAGGTVGPAKGPGFLLEAVTPVTHAVTLQRRRTTYLDLTRAMPRLLAEHLLAGEVASEHRSVAVCFIEFSGVDRMRAELGLGAVAEAVAQVVDACQGAADQHDVMFLSSDICPDGGKVILVAGAPRNTGDDATRVLAAARQVIDSAQTLPLRAGVNVGRVFAGDYGPGYRRVYSITGDCVNLAARLMAKAGHGELVASAAALAACRTPFRTTPLEPFRVKGKSDQIDASLVGEPDREHRAGGGPVLPLVGRDDELAELSAQWSLARGGAGRLVELVGDPGAGKSRLLQELVEVTGTQPVWLDGNIYGTHTPYEPFQRLFAERVGIAREADGAAAQLRDLVADLDPDQLPWLPLIGIVAGIEVAETASVTELDAAARKARLEAATGAVLARLLPDATLLVFNDVDFMDDASTDLLDRLAADAGDRPWLLVATRRHTAIWRPAPETAATTVVLSALSADAADELLAAALPGGALPPHRMSALVERAGGNPLFLTELAAGLGRGLEEDAIPDTVEGVIGARIDLLPPPTRAILRAAAVLGVRVERELLEGLVARVPALPSVSVLDDLSDLLGPGGPDTLVFAHNLVRETAYAGLPFRRRRELHGIVADLLLTTSLVATTQPELLSLHSYHAGRFEDALDYSTRAAALALSQYALSEAGENYRRALNAGRRLPAAKRDPRRLGELWFAICSVYEDLGDLEAMGRAVGEARKLLTADPFDEARVAEMAATHRRLSGDYPGSLRWLTSGMKALEGLTSTDARSLRGTMFERYARTRLSQGKLRDAISWADRAVQEFRSACDRRGEAIAIETRSVAQSNAGVVVDLDEAARAIALWSEQRDLNKVARTHSVVGVLALNQNEWKRSLVHYRAAMAAYERLGRPGDVALMQVNQAEIMIFQGHLDQSDVLLAAALRGLRGATATTEYGFAMGQQGRVLMSRDRYDEAIEVYLRAREIQVSVGDLYEVVVLDALIAEAHQLLGNGEQALAQIADVRERNRGVGAALDYLVRVEGYAQVLCGRREEGLQILRTALADCREKKARYDEWRLLIALFEVGAGTGQDAEALLGLRSIMLDRMGIHPDLVARAEALVPR